MRRSRAVLFLLALAAGALLAFPILFHGTDSAGGGRPGETATEERSEAPPPPPAPSAPAEGRTTKGVRGSADASSVANLRVTVLDPWNRPVDSARVRAIPLGQPSRERWRRSGRGDRISLLLPRGEPLRIEAESTSRFYREVKEPVLAEQGEVTVVLRARGARVSGRVVAESTGRSIPGATFEFGFDGTDYRLPASLSPEGEFDFLVRAGEVHLFAGVPGLGKADWSASLLEGEWRCGIVLPLSGGPLCSFSGRVSDDEGDPIRGALVVLTTFSPRQEPTQTSVSSDVEGDFRVEPLGAGEYRLTVTAFPLESAGPVRVVLDEGANVASVVLARSSGLRIRGVLPDGSSVEEGQILVRRGARFVARATVFPARVERHGGARSRFDTRSAGGRIEGVRLLDDPSFWTGERALGPADPEGYHRIDGLAWGEYEVIVVAPPLVGRADVFVRPGETERVDVFVTERG
ncbi:MAG: carboxypeptidase-like regulatory domain-containing protein [Planctomycetes bacterium]|nr:carboxypeptidase-like regulatory domain-containing protein [Planctomycetota bacterium]